MALITNFLFRMRAFCVRFSIFGPSICQSQLSKMPKTRLRGQPIARFWPFFDGVNEKPRTFAASKTKKLQRQNKNKKTKETTNYFYRVY